MALIEIIGGCLVGGAVGVLGSLLPGVGGMICSLAGGVLGGLISPLAGAAATVASYVTSTFLGSAKEAIDSGASGNAQLEAVAPETPVEPEKICRSLYASKLIGLMVGLGLNYLAGGVLLSLSTLPITWFVAIGIGLVLFSQMRQFWPIILAILVGSQAYFLLAGALGVTQLVLPLGAAVFLVPSLLDSISKKKEPIASRLERGGICKKIWSCDPVKLIITTIIGACCPGVGPALICGTLTRKGNLVSMLTVAAAEVAIEGYAIAALIQGVTNGKAILVIETGLQFAGPWMIWVFVAAALLCGFFLMNIYSSYSKVAVTPGTSFLALLFTVATIVMTAGPVLGLLLIVVGIGLKLVMRAAGAPKNLGSLLYLGPTLFK
jgi:hypothetical protein